MTTKVSHSDALKNELRVALNAVMATKGLTQTDVAQKLGIERTIINRMAHRTRDVSIETYLQILDKLGIEVVFSLRRR